MPVDEDNGASDCVEVESTSASRRSQRPTCNKVAKDDPHRTKVKESTVRAQAKATLEMVVANAKKAAVMRDQVGLQLFSILDDQITSDMVGEYLQLRCEEELTKVKRRIQLTKEAISKEDGVAALAT